MRQRYTVLDTPALMELVEIESHEQLVTQQKEWVEQALKFSMGEDGKDP